MSGVALQRLNESSHQQYKNMKTYTQASRGLTANPTLLITTVLAGITTTVTLGELPDYLESKGLENVMPRDTNVEGAKVGVFPVLSPRTKTAAIAMRAKGMEVGWKNGWSFATQAQACKCAAELVKLGIALDELTMDWMVSPVPGATPAPLALPLKPAQSNPTTEADSKSIFG